MSVESLNVKANSRPHGVDALDFGLEQEDFHARYFEQNVLLLRGVLRERITWADVDKLLYFIDPSPPYFKLYQNGEVPLEEFADEALASGLPQRRLNKAKFYEHLRSGATAVLNRVETAMLPAQRLCNAVARFSGQPTIGNAYLTFGGNGTFGKHWDTHDVFAIQLLGKKRWRVFRPTWPLPLSHHTSKAQQSQCPAEPVLDIELCEGDVLYLPRGWWHETVPGSGGSFHLSVGTYAPTVLEFLQWSCAQLEGDSAVRAGLTGDSQQVLAVNALLEALRATLAHPQSLARFLASSADRETTRGEFDLQAQLAAADALPDFAVASLCSRVAPRFDGPHLVLNGSLMRLEPLRRALVLKLADGAMTLRSLHAALPAAPKVAIRAALLDLSQHDIVDIRRD